MDFSCGAILFDLDGVLVHSEECVRRHWGRWCEKTGIPFGKVTSIAHGRRTSDTIRVVAPHLDAEKEAAELTMQEAQDMEGVFPVEGAHALLDSIPARSWAVVTTGTLSVAAGRIRYVKLPKPQVLITADDVHMGKPDPEGYILAAQRLNVSAERCLVLEDAPPGIRAARAAGMAVIGVLTTHRIDQLYEADIVVQDLRSLHVRLCGSPEHLCLTVKSAIAP